MQAWKPEEIEFLHSHLEETTKEIYNKFRDEYGVTRSYNSVQKKVQVVRDAFSDFDEEDSPTIVEDEVDELLWTSSLSSVPKISNAERKARRENTKEWLEDLIDFSKEVDFNTEAAAIESELPSIVIVLSDTHFGKKTKWFDMEEAKKRMLSIPERLVRQNVPKFDECVLVLAGDMIEGEGIYLTQHGHIECAAIDQVKVCADTVWKLAVTMREVFDCNVRMVTVPGNHGRVSKTANERTNWDNVVYHLLNVMTSMYKDEKINIECNFEEFTTFKVKNKVGMAYHHGVKHTGTSSMREKVAGWISTKKFDFMVHGHWHEWHIGNWLGRLVVANGCMCGPDDLAERMGKEETARQAYFFVDKTVWGFSYFEWETDFSKG